MIHRNILIALVVVLATIPGTAAADNPIDGFVTDEGDDGECLDSLQFLCSLRDGGLARLSDVVDGIGDDQTADGIADDLQATFNDHSGAFESYANERLSPDSNSADVFELTVRDDDEESTIYLTTDVVNGNYTNASLDDSTSRTVDESCTIEENAARNAPDELDEFHSENVEPNESLTNSYMDAMATRYAGNVNCSFMESDS